MENTSVSRVEESLRLFLQLAWSFGVPNIRVRYIWRVSYTLILGLCLFLVNYFFYDERIRIVFSLAIKDVGVALFADFILFISIYVTIIVWAIIGARTVQDVISNLGKIDTVISDHKYYRGTQLRLRRENFWVGLHFFVYAAKLIFHLISTHQKVYTDSSSDSSAVVVVIYYFLSTEVPRFQLILSYNLLSAVIRVIQFRFQVINTALYRMGNSNDRFTTLNQNLSSNRRGEEIVPFEDRSYVMNSEADRTSKDLDVLQKMHERLSEITEKLIIAFWPCLIAMPLVALLLCMQHSLSILYTMNLTVTSVQEKFVTVTIAALGLVQNVTTCWMVVLSCNDLSAEANKFGIMLHRIDILDAVFHRKLHEFSIKHYCEKLIVIAGGFFPIDSSCMTYILSTVTAYTIFIYQLNNA